MQQPYIQVNPAAKDNYKAGKDTANIMQLHNIGHTASTAKTYLATDKGNHKVTGTEKQESAVIHDFFGAFNY